MPETSIPWLKKTGALWIWCPQKFGESFHCFESSREWFLPGTSGHALVAGVLGFKALKAILRICRVCVKVGKGSSCNCSSQRLQRVGDREILEKAKEGMEN